MREMGVSSKYSFDKSDMIRGSHIISYLASSSDTDSVTKVGEHPTQALLDTFTIWDELGLSLDVTDGENESEKKHTGQLVVVLLGDLKHGRTVHSLAKLLARSSILLARSSIKHDLVLRYCAPPSLEMPSHVKEYVEKFPNAKQEVYTDIREAVQGANVLYVTRVQKERFETAEDYEKVKVSWSHHWNC